MGDLVNQCTSALIRKDFTQLILMAPPTVLLANSRLLKEALFIALEQENEITSQALGIMEAIRPALQKDFLDVKQQLVRALHRLAKKTPNLNNTRLAEVLRLWDEPISTDSTEQELRLRIPLNEENFGEIGLNEAIQRARQILTSTYPTNVLQECAFNLLKSCVPAILESIPLEDLRYFRIVFLHNYF